MQKVVKQTSQETPSVFPVDYSIHRGWKEQLDRLKIGWGAEEYNIGVGAGPVVIPRRLHERFLRMGPLIRDFLKTTRDLYLEDLVSDAGSGFVSGLLEAGLEEADVLKQRDWSTLLKSRLPSLVRADVADFGGISELQIYMMGLGTSSSINDVMLGGGSNFGIGLAKGFANMARELTGKKDPKILYLYAPYPGIDREGLYFFEKVEEELGAGAVSVAFGNSLKEATHDPRCGILPPLDGFDLVYTGPMKASVLEEQYENIDSLWKAYSAGNS